jgi:hypothetical protein
MYQKSILVSRLKSSPSVEKSADVVHKGTCRTTSSFLFGEVHQRICAEYSMAGSELQLVWV